MNSIVKENKQYTYTILKSDAIFLKYEYNELQIGSIGKSMLNEDILFLKLGTGGNRIMINAAHDANEWKTSLVLMMFAEKFLQLYKEGKIYKGYDIREIWRKNSIYIIPMVNPDGVNLSLKDNIVINNLKYKEIWKLH